MSSIAHTLLSTIPVGKKRSRRVFSPMSVWIPDDFFGQATHMAPSAGSIDIALEKPRSASAALSAKMRYRSAGASVRWISTSSGRSPKSNSK